MVEILKECKSKLALLFIMGLQTKFILFFPAPLWQLPRDRGGRT